MSAEGRISVFTLIYISATCAIGVKLGNLAWDKIVVPRISKK